jgi:Family of unknown function (DUF6941)
MEIEFAVIADYATTTSENKLVIGGIFDTVYAPDMPAQHPVMALALRVRAHPGEEGRHAITVRLVDPDGAEVVQPLEAPFEIGVGDQLEGGTADLVLQLNGVPFETFGRHSFDIFVDGRFEKGVMLSVRRAPTGPPGGEMPADPFEDLPQD